MADKKMSYWWILVFALLIFIGTNVYDHYKEKNQYDQEKQSKIDQCNSLYQNQTQAQQCEDYELKRLAFSKEFNEGTKPLYPISSVLTALILGVILFFTIRYIRKIYV